MARFDLIDRFNVTLTDAWSSWFTLDRIDDFYIECRTNPAKVEFGVAGPSGIPEQRGESVYVAAGSYLSLTESSVGGAQHFRLANYTAGSNAVVDFKAICKG